MRRLVPRCLGNARNPKICRFLRATVSACTLLVSACTALPHNSRTEIPTEAAQRTLAVGFQQLSDRYVKYLPVGELAFEGLRGLNLLDPDFEAKRTGEIVSFGVDVGRLHAVPMPDETDADGWAALAVDAVRLMQSESNTIASASVERIYEAIFDGSLSLLDTYSRYSSADEAVRNRDKRSGFGGIGVVVKNTARGASVVQVVANSPAVQAGLVEGDIITHIDHAPIGRLTDLSDVARGPIGTSVQLRVVKHSGEALDIDVRRQRVIAPTVEVAVRDDIVTARISGFSRSTARELRTQVNDAVTRLAGAARGLILDLRGNPGGLLSEAVRVADLFIAEGRILTTQGRHPSSVHDYDAREEDIASGLPMVVLINGRSASASEIVAAALQDHDRAIVVGSSSFGKGSIQMVIALPNEGELTITWSQFITPSGYVLNGLGVHPSICTSASDANAEQLIRRALDGGNNLAQILDTWRHIDSHPETDRKGMKALCPASDSVANRDTTVAETVIGDADLYRRILAFAPTVLAAQK